MQILNNVEQGSDEWHALRLGVITASRFKDVLSGGKGLTRKSYMRELAAETLTGEREGITSNKYIEWGTQTEEQARSMYELETALIVEEIGFIEHKYLNAGCSPDGLVSADGLIEIKCPKSTTQIETFLKGDMPESHKPQAQGQLWISDREWCDFVSFDPRINAKASYFCIRVYRDEDYIKNLETEVEKFQDELNSLINKLS